MKEKITYWCCVGVIGCGKNKQTTNPAIIKQRCLKCGRWMKHSDSPFFKNPPAEEIKT